MKFLLFLWCLLATPAFADFVFKPLPATGNGAATYDTAGDLPTTGVSDGAMAITLDDHALYIFNLGTTSWVLQTASTGVAGPGTSVDNEIMLWSGTGGATAKRATGTGIVKATSGVYSTGTVAVAEGGTGATTAATARSNLAAAAAGANTDITSLTLGNGATRCLLGDNDTGLCFTSDGAIDFTNNGFANFGLSQNYVRFEGVDYVFPNAQGGADQVLTNDGSGNLSWTSASLNLPVSEIENHDPLDTSSNRFAFQTNIIPSVDSSNATINEIYVQVDADADEPLNTLRLFSGNLSAGGDSNIGDMTALSFGITFGNGTDTQTLATMNGTNTSLLVHDNATVTSLVANHLNVTSDAAGIVNDATIYSGNINFQNDVSNNLALISIGGAATNVAGNVNVANLSPNFSGDIGSFNGINIGANIVGETSGYAKWFTANGNLGDTNGGAVFSSTLNIDTNLTNFNGFEDSTNLTVTDGYTSLNAHPNVTTITGQGYGITLSPNIGATNGYTGIQIGGTVTSSTANVVGIDEGIHIDTTTTNYISANLHPQIDAMTGSYTGIQISPSAVGDGGDSAVGLSINMGSATNFSEVKAINADGLVTAQANVAIVTAVNPTPVHAFNTGFSSPDSSTITGIDRFGFGPIMAIDTGDNSTLTSGAFGLGLASLGMINLVDVGNASDLDNATGSFVAMVNTGNGGNIQNLHGYTAVFATGGGSTTVGNTYAFETKNGGVGATASWGIYDTYADYNWLANSVKIGGSAGSTDRVIASDLSLETEEGIKLGTTNAKGTCDADHRGTFWIDQGGAGVTDEVFVCLKSAADSHNWVSITTGG